VERNSLSMATHYFSKSCDCARTTVQKVYTLLLKYRALVLDGKKRQAEEVLRLCLGLDRTCPEVVFEEVIGKFESEKTREAIDQLLELVANHREYWAAAIICPEFAHCHDLIVTELWKILQKVRDEGRNLVSRAEATLVNLKQAIGEEDGDMRGLQTRYGEIEGLALNDTYFGWLDSIRAASILAADCIKVERDRRAKIQRVISGLQDRLFSIIHNGYTQGADIQKTIGLLKEGTSRADADLHALQPHKTILSYCAQFSDKMDQLEKRLLALEQRDRMMSRIRAFLKDSVVFLGIAAILGAVAAPLVLRSLKTTDFVSGVLDETGVFWIYDTLAVMAAISSICFAIVRGIVRGQKGQRRVVPAKR
jgi:hypothetical protein